MGRIVLPWIYWACFPILSHSYSSGRFCWGLQVAETAELLGLFSDSCTRLIVCEPVRVTFTPARFSWVGETGRVSPDQADRRSAPIAYLRVLRSWSLLTALCLARPISQRGFWCDFCHFSQRDGLGCLGLPGQQNGLFWRGFGQQHGLCRWDDQLNGRFLARGLKSILHGYNHGRWEV